MKAARLDEPLLQRCGQRGAGVDVAGDLLQHIGLPRVVLEKLARQLDRIPGNTIDSGKARVVDARQQVVQAVAELVEQRQHVVVREERRMSAARRQEIADEIGHRQRRACGEMFAADALIHPGAAALVGTRVGIEIEAADGVARRIRDLKEAHVRMPQRNSVARADANIK